MYQLKQEQAVIDIVELANDYNIEVCEELRKEYEKIMEKRKTTMTAIYEMTLKVKVACDVEELKSIKNNREYAEDVAQMICDEATVTGGVAQVDIIESAMDVR